MKFRGFELRMRNWLPDASSELVMQGASFAVITHSARVLLLTTKDLGTLALDYLVVSVSHLHR